MNIITQIYWIRSEHHTDCFSEGYIGVTKNPKVRFLDHLRQVLNKTHKNPHLTHAINFYGWDNLKKEIILIGPEDYCYEVEGLLRPEKKIGWNIAVSGHRGPGWPKGRRKSIETIEKMRATKKIRSEQSREEKTKLTEIKKEERARRRQEKNDFTAKEKLKLREDRLKLRQEKLELKNRITKSKKQFKEIQVIREHSRPLCKCGLRPRAVNYKKDNKVYYRRLCETCMSNGLYHNIPRWHHAGYKLKNICDKCSFKSPYKEVFSVFHIDGNLNNCRLTNLKTVCANCQRILHLEGITWKQGDLRPDF